MADTDHTDEILSNVNFKTLASSKTGSDEFLRLIEANVSAYVQRKRLADALKALLVKVEAAENKLSVIKSVGKAKQLEGDEKILADTYSSFDLRDKLQVLNPMVQCMIEEGRLTNAEIPQVLTNLRTRIAAAKAAGKDKLLEKLDKMIDCVLKVKVPITSPVANLDEIYVIKKNLRDIQLLEKIPAKNLAWEDRDRINKKAKVEVDMKLLELRSRMWFETEEEFNPRLQQALAVREKEESERKKREEEEANERKRIEAEQLVERKRLEVIEKEEAAHRALMEKLEAKRIADLAKPQKEVVVVKKKERAVRTKLDNRELFTLPPRNEEDDEIATSDVQSEAVDVTVATPSQAPSEAPSATPAATPLPSPMMAPTPAPTSVGYPDAKTQQKPAKAPKPAIESKWDTPAPVTAELQEVPEELAGPSLADAAKAAPVIKKAPAPAPKKKEKKKFSKLGADVLGFDCDNRNYA